MPTFATQYTLLKNTTRAHLALLGTNIFFAINYTAIKWLVGKHIIQPFGLNLVRVGVTAMLLWSMRLFDPAKGNFTKKEYGRLALCALTGIAINQLLFVKGLSLTYSIHASLLMLTTPILITVIAAWLLKEMLTGMKLAGLALGIIGAAILVSARPSGGHADNVLLGDILIIINAVSYTFYFVLVKPLMARYDPVVVIRMLFTFGFFLILPFCLTEFTEIQWSAFQPMDYLVLFLIVVPGTFLAYIFNVYGIKVLGASLAGTYIYSQPVFAASIAMMFLGEKLDLYKFFAACCIGAGVYLSNRASTTKVSAITE